MRLLPSIQTRCLLLLYCRSEPFLSIPRASLKSVKSNVSDADLRRHGSDVKRSDVDLRRHDSEVKLRRHGSDVRRHVSIIDLNNNNVSDQGVSRSNSARMTPHRQEDLQRMTPQTQRQEDLQRMTQHGQEDLQSKSSHPTPSVSRNLEMNVMSNNLTREQIISLFSAGQEEPGPFSQSEARTGTGRANERARL